MRAQNFHFRKALLPGGWADAVRIEVLGDRISAVQAGVRPDAGEAVVGLAIPGLCNAHSHAFQRALAGHTEQRSPAHRDNFWTWRERMYELAGRVSAEVLTAIARQVYCEMLVSGYTAVCEFHYLHTDPVHDAPGDVMFEAIVSAARDAGIRLTYVPVLYERRGFTEARPTAQQASFALGVDEYLDHVRRIDSQAGVRSGVGVHSLRAVTAESLQRVAAFANERAMPFHIHVAEQQQEVEDCLAAYGQRPVEWLTQNFDVGPNWCLVHATHMTDDEVDALAASGAVVALCPSTEANLGDGLFSLQRYLAAGGNMAIGSDSHVSINPFEELRWLEYGQRLATETRNIASFVDSHVGSELFDRALSGGAAASGESAPGITVGAPADLVVLNDEDPMLLGHSDATRLDALVFSGYPLPVERVMVAGDWRVLDACHVQRDSARAAFAESMTSVWGAA